MTISTVMISIQALLDSAEPNDPQDSIVAEMYKNNRALFDKTAAYWAMKFAGSKKDEGNTSRYEDFASKIDQFMQMTGLKSEQEAIVHLSNNSWDVARASNQLIKWNLQLCL